MWPCAISPSKGVLTVTPCSHSSSGVASVSASDGTAIIYAPGTSAPAGDASWSYDNNSWKLKKPDGNFANGEWRQVSWNGINNWYHFNNNGYADGGWYTDTDGHRYYLYNFHDGAFGRMLTGWNEIDGKWYYFNTATTATVPLGSLLTSGTTPDGYHVNADGVWAQ